MSERLSFTRSLYLPEAVEAANKNILRTEHFCPTQGNR